MGVKVRKNPFVSISKIGNEHPMKEKMRRAEEEKKMPEKMKEMPKKSKKR